MLPSALNFPEWLAENKHRLQPPVCNCVFQEGEDYQIMVVGGPNSRTDFHINPTEEWFYQVRGRMLLRMADPTTHEIKDEYIEEGGMLLLPAMTPHSPNRFADTVGLVVERKRPGQKEAMRWYCEQCNAIVHEKWFVCESLEKDLVPVIQEYKNSEELRTCKKCGYLNSTVYPAKEPGTGGH
ncbi:3-hydroxyanthranilic acid dioxygenase [Coemansia erecta]|uniref:3-hydroxyanthranilate 3,4-dioxygenase n=1 Tax=Coemansia asiatica TaxID=1052880 RepID=A0A9W7XPU4_9FUNG|nr:3-hydroxyanthranilic acid dioxygenase [Coemansia asiatica]KAJ2847272.1 3-hydroxyanthranilic acid dioxygenase [Coemansia erecta]